MYQRDQLFQAVSEIFVPGRTNTSGVQRLHDIAMQRWVSTDNVCFVNGGCMYGLAVVETLWKPTGIYWN